MTADVESTVTITRRGEERLRAGHPWIYRSDVRDDGAPGGAVVRVVSQKGRLLGRAIYSDRSQIALRWMAEGDEPVDDALLRRRLERAIALRESLAIDADAYRVVHAEADGLPALIVDRYRDVLVVQALAQGSDRWLERIVDLLAELLAPRGILARNDARVRDLEGLPREVRVAHGEVGESVVVRDGTLELEVDLRAGQKTGLFLDQRDNREAAGRLARGRGLDVFSYSGGFALRLARVCTDVTAVEISADASARIQANARRNGIANLSVATANAFDWLRAADERGDRFDTIVLDPPAFAKSRAALAKALGGYKEVNLRAMRLLAPGGVLVTSSCSHHVDEATFSGVLADAAADVGARMALIERRGQALDHPVVLGIPESSYLKCFVLRRLR